MKAFDLDKEILKNYEAFSRSFTFIRAEDLRAKVDSNYADGRFWPEALLSINPRFHSGKSSVELAEAGVITSDTAKIFGVDRSPIRFHRHQEEAITKASKGQSFVVTTGTGSGKSLCFFVPIVDAVIRARKLGQPRWTRAIIVYPMNALANSQIKEIEKFIAQSGLPDQMRPVVRRYTGQESDAERQEVASNPPDILLTNYMMLELLLTRQDGLDARVIGNASGLQFIVLDELHTYRGRQGADVAILIRRLKDRCATGANPICIGTSATMANEGSEASVQATVSRVASRLFGAEIGPDAVIDETLQRATETGHPTTAALAKALTQGLPAVLTDDMLKLHPLAIWTENTIGLNEGQKLTRKRPTPFGEAAGLLAAASGLDMTACAAALSRDSLVGQRM